MRRSRLSVPLSPAVSTATLKALVELKVDVNIDNDFPLEMLIGL